MADEFPKTEDLLAYQARLMSAPDAPIGDLPARALVARTVAAMREQNAAHRTFNAEMVDMLQHFAKELRDAAADLDRGKTGDAREHLMAIVAALDASIVTSEAAGHA